MDTDKPDDNAASVVITFSGIDIRVDFGGAVTSAQLWAASRLLQMEGDINFANMRAQQLAQQQSKGLALAHSLPNLRD